MNTTSAPSWLGLAYVAIGAIIGFASSYGLRRLDLRRRRRAFRVQTRAALDLARSIIQGSSPGPEVSESLTARLSDLFFTVDATLCFDDAALHTACQLPTMMKQSELLTRRSQELRAGLATIEPEIRGLTHQAKVMLSSYMMDDAAALEARYETMKADLEDAETQRVALVARLTSMIGETCKALRR